VAPQVIACLTRDRTTDRNGPIPTVGFESAPQNVGRRLGLHRG